MAPDVRQLNNRLHQVAVRDNQGDAGIPMAHETAETNHRGTSTAQTRRLKKATRGSSVVVRLGVSLLTPANSRVRSIRVGRRAAAPSTARVSVASVVSAPGTARSISSTRNVIGVKVRFSLKLHLAAFSIVLRDRKAPEDVPPGSNDKERARRKDLISANKMSSALFQQRVVLGVDCLTKEIVSSIRTAMGFSWEVEDVEDQEVGHGRALGHDDSI
ncbi:hypothetical protein CCMA1212_008913 [Trichoderma ghanense]|uniref:Uncharacterized protein n=1 Tax=Trichoderma ghanense TaxID=65468 RepID=A0ABY2GW36_9HYPO